MPVVARHLTIHGKVQGVWYRNWTVDAARTLGLNGWVRNRADGCVEALVEGAEEAVTRFTTLAHVGPPAARVARVDIQDVMVEGLSGFEKRATL